MFLVPRWVKTTVIVGGGVLVAGTLFFGSDVFSYLSKSAASVQSAVKDNVPIEFELARAENMLNDIVPEMHANIRLIATEEVEIASLKNDIVRSQKNLAEERARVKTIREKVAEARPTYTLGNITYTHEQMKDELSHRFDQLREAEVVLAGKERLLSTREKSLQAALQMLSRTRSQKSHLEDQITSLESQYRLVKAAATGTTLSIDKSRLAKTEQLIDQIKKRLDVAERVLSHEAKFTQPIAIDVVSDADLIRQVDAYLAKGATAPNAEATPAAQ